jgi:hypothetical protein
MLFPIVLQVKFRVFLRAMAGLSYIEEALFAKHLN